MAVIICGGLKGGGGKSTIATNLAVMRSKAGYDVLLVDADDQETSADFTALRTEKEGTAGYTCVKLTGPLVRTQVQRLAKKHDDVIIDVGGRDTTSQRAAMVVADLLLVPFVPRSFDVWTIEKVAQLTEEMRPTNPKLKAVCFINRADARGQDNAETAEVLRETKGVEFIPISLGARKSFANAAARGLAVTEIKPTDAKAVEEMETLYKYVFGIISTSKKV
jgi:chromosome partitioning protein